MEDIRCPLWFQVKWGMPGILYDSKSSGKYSVFFQHLQILLYKENFIFKKILYSMDNIHASISLEKPIILCFQCNMDYFNYILGKEDYI